ncbi:MAG TPA: hypothetical protein VMV91_05740 [Rhodocyclaceae bacterium]|nr:hypothetical protein [Rhodocyclaceae bacterium]
MSLGVRHNGYLEADLDDHFAGAGKPIPGGKGGCPQRTRASHLAAANMQDWPLDLIHNYNYAQR